MDPRDAYHLGSVPLGVAVAGLFVIVMARSHGTYWAGRGVVRGAQAVARAARARPAGGTPPIRRLEAWTDTAQRPARASTWCGAGAPIAVTLAYLTVGLQTAIFAAAGLVKMPYLRFAIASVPGALVWAVVWATIGFGAVWGAIALFATSPWALAGAVLLVRRSWSAGWSGADSCAERGAVPRRAFRPRSDPACPPPRRSAGPAARTSRPRATGAAGRRRATARRGTPARRRRPARS